ncbi:MAG: polyprenyl synthetase family protein [Chloroflexi bacterium]|nr:polyprenyl synthetase family protein [Chloroflexota bacterium]
MIDIDVGRIERAKHSLEEFRLRVNDALEKYVGEKASALKKVDALGEEAGSLMENFILRGGKRIRAAFTYYGYRAVGGDEEDHILLPSASIEILHSFFLIHDDIIDKSDLRRGLPTIHEEYKSRYNKRGLLAGLDESDKTHFGSSMAIMVGDICFSLAYEALVDSEFEPGRVLEALRTMHEVLRFTGVGEMQDIVEATARKATEEQVLRMNYLKTAKYTVEGPLHLGAVLHGTTPDVLDAFSKYAVPVGIAFQIHDDVLGVFGTEEDMGKPIGSDIREGKQTLLTIRAFDGASPSQKVRLEALMCNPAVTEADVAEVRRIIEDTGALDYSRAKELALVEEGKRAISRADIREDVRDILLGMADIMIERAC